MKTMSKRLLAMATMAALTGLANIAKAEEVRPVVSVTGVQHQDTQLVMLTDTQMDGVAAGHLDKPPYMNNNNEHTGYYWKAGFSFFPPHPTLEIAFGKHRRCGSLPCRG